MPAAGNLPGSHRVNMLGLPSVPPLMPLMILTLFACLFTASAEVITLTAQNRSSASASPISSTKTITLAEGESATTKYLTENGFLDIQINGVLFRIGLSEHPQAALPVVAGPASIKLTNFSTTNQGLATLAVTRNPSTPSSSPGVVVIPDDGSGDHQVALESSKDMVNWTPTQAGVFNSSNANRFFRVRIRKTTE